MSAQFFYGQRYNDQGNPVFTGPIGTIPGLNDGATSATIPIAVDDVDAYFLTSLNGAAWAALTPDVKAAALKESQRWLGTLCMDPGADCCGDFDAALLMATSELALVLAKNPGIMTGINATPGLYVSDNRLGDLGQSYAAFPAGSTKYGANAPQILHKLPFIGDILGCWLVGSFGNSRVLSRC
jgi:hypothetical protein